MLGAWLIPNSRAYKALAIKEKYGEESTKIGAPAAPIRAGAHALARVFPWIEALAEKTDEEITLELLRKGWSFIRPYGNGKTALVVLDLGDRPRYVQLALRDCFNGHFSSFGIRAEHVILHDVKGKSEQIKEDDVLPSSQKEKEEDAIRLLRNEVSLLRAGEFRYVDSILDTDAFLEKSEDGKIQGERDNAFPDEARDAVEQISLAMRGEKYDSDPILAWGGETLLLRLQEMTESSLTESSFQKLLNLTAQNGVYAIGGMRRVGTNWVYDPSVPGRRQNARFVIARPPIVTREGDDLLLRFRFQSRRDRSTTGATHSGYVKFLEPKRFFKRLVHSILRPTQFRQDVECYCSCQDFQYRWHYVLSRDGSAPRPTGAGNAPPFITNPTGAVSLCKHLAAIASYLQMNKKDLASVSDLVQPMADDQTGDEPVPEGERN